MESITLSDGTQHHSVPEVHQGLSAHYADHFTPKGSQGTGLHAPGFDIQAVLHSKEAFLEATASLPIPASHRYLLDIIYDAISTQSAAMQAVAAELNTILAPPPLQETQAAINSNGENQLRVCRSRPMR